MFTVKAQGKTFYFEEFTSGTLIDLRTFDLRTHDLRALHITPYEREPQDLIT
jgi:hypothetical protein